MQSAKAINDISESAMSYSNKSIKFAHLKKLANSQCCMAHI